MKKKYRPNIPKYDFLAKPYTEAERAMHGKVEEYLEPELADILVIQVLSVDKDKKARFIREIEKAAIRMQMTMNKKVLKK